LKKEVDAGKIAKAFGVSWSFCYDTMLFDALRVMGTGKSFFWLLSHLLYRMRKSRQLPVAMAIWYLETT